jgi:hypothetical protein
MRADAGGVLDPMDDEGSFDDGDPYTTNLYIGMTHMLRQHRPLASLCDLHSIMIVVVEARNAFCPKLTGISLWFCLRT